MEKQNYNTKSRRCILDFLENSSHTTVTAADILEYLNNQGISVNFTTVYRYLTKLTRERKVIKLNREDGQGALYQLVATQKSCNEHIHIRCISCGRLLHLDCGFMDKLREHICDEHGFELRCEGSVLYGVCNDCKK